MSVSFFVDYIDSSEESIKKSQKAGNAFALYTVELEMTLEDKDKRMRFYNDRLEIVLEFLSDTIRKISITGEGENLHKLLLQDLYKQNGINVYEKNS